MYKRQEFPHEDELNGKNLFKHLGYESFFVLDFYEDENVDIVWDTDKPNGDKIRLMDMTRAKSYGFETKISLEDGIRELMDYYREEVRENGE